MHEFQHPLVVAVVVAVAVVAAVFDMSCHIVDIFLLGPISTGVNFINVLHTNFSYERCFSSFFSSYMYVVKAAETMFVRKICTFNVDEIDTRLTPYSSTILIGSLK